VVGDMPAGGLGDGASVRGTFGGVGTFHLSEQSPVEGVYHDRVALAGVVDQAGPIDGGPGALVTVDAVDGDARGGQRVKLAVQALFSAGDSGVAQVQPARRVLVAGHHMVIVPEVVTVAWFRNA
jgi:hypothetical protein